MALYNVMVELDSKGLSKGIMPELEYLGGLVAEFIGGIALLGLEAASFIPGVIGIVACLILALKCLAVGDIKGFFINLIGCIPFVKLCKVWLPGAAKCILKNPAVMEFMKKVPTEGILNGAAKPIKTMVGKLKKTENFFVNGKYSNVDYSGSLNYTTQRGTGSLFGQVVSQSRKGQANLRYSINPPTGVPGTRYGRLGHIKI